MDGVFITGTDTDVGKTAISGAILKMLQGHRNAVYWKPVQTGTILGDDTKSLIEMTGLSGDKFETPGYRFPEPLSPHLAAAKWGKSVEIDSLVEKYEAMTAQGKFVVVEGAGGLLVPLNERTLQVTLIKRLKTPVIVVAEDRLGAINHSLLTLQACREIDIPVLGLILTKGGGNFGNSATIEQFGKVDILGEYKKVDDIRGLLGQVATSPAIRKLFKLPKLPE